MTTESTTAEQSQNDSTESLARLVRCTFAVGLALLIAYRVFDNSATAQADEPASTNPASSSQSEARTTSDSKEIQQATSTRKKKATSVTPVASTGKQNRATVKSKVHEVRPLSTYPQLAKAQTRAHRVVELKLNEVTTESPEHRHEKAITVLTRNKEAKEFLLETRSWFFLADELVCSRVDGTPLLPKQVLEAFAMEQVVAVTHHPNKLPEAYVSALRDDTIVVQLPLVPKVSVDGTAFGQAPEPDEDELHLLLDGPYPAIDTFPQLCIAKAKELGIIQVEGCNLYYFTPKSRKEKGIVVSTRQGTRELALSSSRRRYLATELRAYYADGTHLSRGQLLSEVSPQRPVLVTMAPQAIPPEYLAVLSERAVIFEVPFDPVVEINSSNRLADFIYPLPPSGLPNSLSDTR